MYGCDKFFSVDLGLEEVAQSPSDDFPTVGAAA